MHIYSNIEMDKRTNVSKNNRENTAVALQAAATVDRQP